MNGPEHYREAERLADAYKSAIGDIEGLPHDTERQQTAQPCACGSPDTYSLNPAEVVTHSAKVCRVSPVSDGGAS